jgi:hypothetical protein
LNWFYLVSQGFFLSSFISVLTRRRRRHTFIRRLCEKNNWQKKKRGALTRALPEHSPTMHRLRLTASLVSCLALATAQAVGAQVSGFPSLIVRAPHAPRATSARSHTHMRPNTHAQKTAPPPVPGRVSTAACSRAGAPRRRRPICFAELVSFSFLSLSLSLSSLFFFLGRLSRQLRRPTASLSSPAPPPPRTWDNAGPSPPPCPPGRAWAAFARTSWPP